ncbi:sn-glycerol-3-phosphate import ATP-binding protein UgpC [Sphaerisporangium siamense]|uniref:ABC-type sugar transport system ATPase subunit n=1 Tax=Sphaerisporangium siamense TaxID=795645 RepID=A0A7W7GA54_9ACTN|nr:ABC transporter ATP-binding protein [Sphaerisporangium siamense]MBB4703568.1 ABC-type sugar transport system ATPase subunit [Sphaerisporangium siamense]GII82039.1 sn-glycerol-3-phosphate import ATP-binding protein UgpC [Sphaerisporangium siamense]
MIALHGLTKEFPGGVRAVDGLDLEIAAGEFFALLGPSGCGKTTLLRTIAGLETPTAGRIVIGTSDVTALPPGRRDVAMVFQDYALFPHMDVTANIAYPLRIKKTPRAAREATAAETAARLGLAELLARRPGQLSGGQQQRVALARAIACRPSAFLFDEPLSNLDARMRLEARTFLKRLQRELAVTTVFVTHDQAEALAMADRIAVMTAGRIAQVGTPSEVFHRPATTFVASFIGSTPMNLLPGVAAGGALRAAGAVLPSPPGVPDGAEIVYGVRPEYMDLAGSPRVDAFAGEVSVVENMGTSSLVTLEVTRSTGATPEVARSAGETPEVAQGEGGTPEVTRGEGGTLVQAVVPEGGEPSLGDRVWAVPRHARALVYRDDVLVSP